MAVEGWKAGSAISQVFGLRFFVSNVLRQRNPFSDGETSFARLVMESLVGVKCVIRVC